MPKYCEQCIPFLTEGIMDGKPGKDGRARHLSQAPAKVNPRTRIRLGRLPGKPGRLLDEA